MAFDQTTRNRLQKLVSEARLLLTVEFTRQLQNDYGLDPESGNISPIEVLTGLDDERLSTTKILRETFNHYQSTSPNDSAKDLLERIVREQAFTMLNRFAAIRMAEARGIVFESISNGYQSKGFQLYSRIAGSGLGSTFDSYRNYVFSVFDELALDLAVLFDRFSPFGRLFPRQAALEELLDLLNDPEIDHLWAEDETIGWIYQYFNSKDERKKMRDESAAPRNSRELAVRNQFFTPRYVVEFLTDNTLGRTWYEMTRGETALVEKCRYLVRRPNEIFLESGENAPLETDESNENLSQEELLKKPVYVPHRPLKDPREILMLDPACGSMHFGLYAFDLFLAIYEEAWDLEETGTNAFTRSHQLKPLRATYENDKECFIRDVPRLIIENNVHGVDIDPRAVQIAGLSLWLRAQRAWAEQNVKSTDRPQIRRSNIVCAEPMPGEADLLKEFIGKHFSETSEKRLLGEFVRRIFDSMKLAGEAGSLLKIEEQVADLIAGSREQWRKLLENKESYLFEGARINVQPGLDFEVGEITAGDFWDRAEGEIYKALRRYSEASEVGVGYQRRLFADDAAQGFAFIDLCRKRYDAVLMNPPFGEGTASSKEHLKTNYPVSKSDLFAAFIEEAFQRCEHNGFVGAITSRTGFFLSSFEKWRDAVLGRCARVTALIDLGSGVLDTATVETAAYVLSKSANRSSICVNLDDVAVAQKESRLRRLLGPPLDSAVCLIGAAEIASLPGFRFIYWIPKKLQQLFSTLPNLKEAGFHACVGLQTNDDFRFLRTSWEVPREELQSERTWANFYKGGEYSPCFDDIHLVVDWERNGRRIKEHTMFLGNSPSRHVVNEQFYFVSGLAYVNISSVGFSCQPMPEGIVFSIQGQYLGPKEMRNLFDLFSSSTVAALLDVINPGRHYQAGQVQLLPIPRSTTLDTGSRIAEQIAAIKLGQALVCEDSRTFLSVAQDLSDQSLDTIANRQWATLCESRALIAAAFRSIDQRAFELYQLDEASIRFIEAATANAKENDGTYKTTSFAPIECLGSCKHWVAESVISYVVGCLFGRWDIRYTTGRLPSPELPDPFAPLPVCPPGMLQNGIGLPATLEDVPADYPLKIAWNGILIDDAGNPNDVENRLREVFQDVWKDHADAIETEACEILGVPTLREYFRRPAGFFAGHLKRYSKSRRQAPIYLPLSTKSGDYTLWLYYHRLTDQTLYAAVNDFVDPKLRQVKDEAASLGSKHGRSRDDEKRLEHLTELTFELEELRDELLRLAPVWKPNLNDGVQITVSPLWKLFKLPKWRKTLEDTWKKLEKGDYDWAHLAYLFFSERVREKCRHDKSLAIAHGLEDLYEEQTAKPRKSRTKQAQTASLPLADG